MLQAKLRVVGGRHSGKTIPLVTKKFLIGREHDCHLRPNSELVSRHHCVFAVDDYSVRVRDLGSTNGTFVNDHRVQGEVALNSGDRVRVGKLDFELLIGEVAVVAAARNGTGDSSHAMLSGSDASGQETAALVATDTSFEIPVPFPLPSVEDTGSSILPTETSTPVQPAAGPTGDSTVVWTAPPAPGYAPEGYPQMAPPPYQQNPYQQPNPNQPAYSYMPPGMGYQPPMHYPQMPMGYPGMYPQMGGYPPGPVYAPQQAPMTPAPTAPAAAAEPSPDDEAVSMPTVRLPDPKTTGAKAAAPPPPPAPAPSESAPEGEQQAAPSAEDEWSKKKTDQKPQPDGKPSASAADILKNYVQRRPV